MSGLKHDAFQCRQHAKSELIRHAQGIKTPEEQEAERKAQERKEQALAREAAKGSALFGGDV